MSKTFDNIMNKKPFLVSASLAVLASCSVLEERKECPCILEITTNSPASGKVFEVAGFDDKDMVLFDRFESGNCPHKYEREIKRCNLTISGVLRSGEAELSGNGRIVSVKRGLEADSLFAGVTPVDATGETASSTVRLHKQFTTVNVFEEQEREDSCRYGIEVAGSCAGLDVLTLEPVEGDFRYTADFDGGGTSFRILRIDERSQLWVSVFRQDTGETVKKIPARELMIEAGYDCHAEDLQDVEIGINLDNFNCTIFVRNWDEQLIIVEI